MLRLLQQKKNYYQNKTYKKSSKTYLSSLHNNNTTNMNTTNTNNNTTTNNTTTTNTTNKSAYKSQPKSILKKRKGLRVNFGVNKTIRTNRVINLSNLSHH